MFQHRVYHYRKQAEECRLQAGKSKHHDHRESWLKLAAQWQRLAEEVERDGQQAHQPQTKERT
jgi:hypothetical protein